nr:hypothetical protein BaRGS_029631 [Batillaria attramentaria]
MEPTMACQPVFIKPEPLPKFEGEGGSCLAEAFVEATKKLHHYRLAEGAATQWILSALAGCAKADVLSRPAEDRATAEDILGLVKDEFGDRRDLAALLAAFYGRRKGRAEGVYQYAHALSAAASRANRHTADSVLDPMLRGGFIDGLTPAELRCDVKRFVRAKENCTFQDVKNEALRWMRDGADINVAVHRIAISAPESAEVAEMRKQMVALTAQTAELQAQLKASL